MSRCPICDNKPMNCDCTAGEREAHYLAADLQDRIDALEPLSDVRLKAIDIGPNDLLILESPGLLTDEAYHRIKASVANAGIGKCILLDDGLTVAGVLRRKEEAE